MHISLIRPPSKDARKGTPNGQAFVAAALAPEDVALDGLEEVGAMAVDEATEEEGKNQEERSAGDKAAEEQGENPEGQAPVASVPEGAMIWEEKLGQWPVGPETGLSSQGGVRAFEGGIQIQNFQQQINMLEKRHRRPEEGSR